MGQKRREYCQREADLAAELADGKCTVSIEEDGRCLRVVHVAVLDLQQESGLQCTQLGKTNGEWNEGLDVVDIQLPGTKIRSGETPDIALLRLMDSEFPGLFSNVSRVKVW